MIRKLPAFALYPHFITEALRLDKYSSVFCLNTVSGNFESFIKKNIRARVVANSFFPGAYEMNLCLIEGDDFLLSAIDMRRLIQIAQDLDFEPERVEFSSRASLQLPKPVWSFIEESKKIKLSGETVYHKACLNLLLWHLARFYSSIDSSERLKNSPKLSWLVSFYASEVKRLFRTNREVNEAHFRLAHEEIMSISTRVLIVDLPPHTGYRKLPPSLLTRELVVNPDFKLSSVFQPETYLGSRFESIQALLGTLFSYLEFCEHMEYWVFILREYAMQEHLMQALAEKPRENTLFSFRFDDKTAFAFIVSRKS